MIGLISDLQCKAMIYLLDFANPEAPLPESRIFSCIWVMRARMTMIYGHALPCARLMRVAQFTAESKIKQSIKFNANAP